MTTEQNIKRGRQAALISFLLGTSIFGIYFLTSSFKFLFVGYGFITFAGLINVGILISILLKVNRNKENRKKLLTTCGLMLLNIPVILVYCWVAIVLVNTMRITLTNSTRAILSDRIYTDR